MAPSRFDAKRAWAGIVCGAALLVVLCGCKTGDFGRVKPTLVSDDVHAWVGRQAASESGVVPSTADLTDDERELRDLAYQLIEPPYNRDKWNRILYAYGVMPTRGPWGPFDPATYSRKLLDAPVRSPTARYARLIDDIQSDNTQLTLFAAVARRVLDIDGKRKRSLAYVSAPSKYERENARRRMKENALVIAWVHRSLRERANAYQFALERIVIETPSQLAVQAEHALTLLRAHTASAARG